jgi:hypothetical protein
MNDFGYKINTALFLIQELGYEPNHSDLYDPNQPNLGNTNYGNNDNRRVIAWNDSNDAKIDVRLFYAQKRRQEWGRCRWEPTDDSLPYFWRYSNISGKQYCYTPEAVNYVAAAYFICVVIT